MRSVIFDIDGTLADLTHRLHFVTGDRRDWGAFFEGMADDGCYADIRDLVFALGRDGNRILLCSGRPDNYRAATETWLSNHDIPYDALYMRPADDTRPDFIVKAQLLAGMREDGYEPWLTIDDRPSVVSMWREQGLTCLQCRDWDERVPVAPGILTILVGPSGAGKSTWLRQQCLGANPYGIRTRHIISSDEIREDLCGDFRCQDKNDEVFAALHAQVKTRLRHGIPAVVDATNLRKKDRLAVAGLAPPDGMIRYIVLDRPMADKYRDGGWRNQVIGADGQPFDLIAKHAQTFASQLKDILAGDRLPNVEVIDLRIVEQRRAA